jgi:hypothetical protein
MEWNGSLLIFIFYFKKSIIPTLCTIYSILPLENYENNQQGALYRLIYYSKSAVHVSGEVFAHHQEYLTIFTVSGSVHPICCQLVYQDTSWQQNG